MIALNRMVNTPKYVPDYMATSIEKIDFELLERKGIRYIAFDADSTLVPYRGILLSPSTKSFLRLQKKRFKGMCIASNRVTDDLHGIAAELDIPVIRAQLYGRKPRRRFFRRVLKLFNAPPHEVAMVGDKLLADIWGGKHSGLTTIWVEHLGKDGLMDRITMIRKFEKWLLRRFI